ncbi:hypothetical protein DevBK_02405 [Devosia sp. BK]|jgi:hypothetical protein|uniref:hypothetical protein n=1 Tax=unclassified Devosia TaxID=196773 RepID=UPI0007821951|nr:MULTISPECIES: hypothetical protein [unclassified Devosia]MDV3250178.1 hypothetical protein [Devosia sp. BK]
MGLLQIALILLLIGGGWTLLTRKKVTRERDALTLRRVDAYIETIRRERRNADLVAMSDSELRDLLHAGARNYRVASEKRTWFLLGVGGVTLFSAIAIASHDGWRGFGIAMLVGAIAAYGLNEFLARRARAPLERHGIDVERLIVE